jgi:cobalt/nickel transport system permease protein
MAFMVRYLDVVTEEMQPDADRPRVARVRRRDRGTGRCWPGPPGALFIRSYERGERVHLAMLSRGYTGTMPRTDLDPGANARSAR